MSKQIEITLSGVGGQGTILCGTMLAEAAVTYDGRRATLTSEYGVETRGTFAKSDVIISDEEIYFPDVTEPNLIVCLHQVAYNRYSGQCGDTIIIYNEAEIAPNPERSTYERGVDLARIAREVGHPAVVNIVTLGILVGLLQVISDEGARDAIHSFFEKRGEKMIALNLKAYEAGYQIGEAMR